MEYSNKYIERFISLNCAPDILGHRLFPNLKKITESFGIFCALKYNILDKLPEGRQADIFVVGDGKRPFTGAFIAYMTRSYVTSVDPKLDDSEHSGINRLNIVDCMVEDLFILQDPAHAILLFPHSHASIYSSVRKFKGTKRIDVISMPCCYKDDIFIEPDISYTDVGIHSPYNRVNIYFDVRTEDI